MFGFFKSSKPKRRPNNVRARDGYVRLTSAQRRSVCKHGGLTKKQHRRVVKERRAYMAGKRSYRGRAF